MKKHREDWGDLPIYRAVWLRVTNGSGGDATSAVTWRDGPARSSTCWPNRDKIDSLGGVSGDEPSIVREQSHSRRWVTSGSVKDRHGYREGVATRADNNLGVSLVIWFILNVQAGDVAPSHFPNNGTHKVSSIWLDISH
jgi:hypothetical protein